MIWNWLSWNNFDAILLHSSVDQIIFRIIIIHGIPTYGSFVGCMF